MTDSNQIKHDRPALTARPAIFSLRLIAIALGFILLYIFYVSDLSNNPPGFYIDESAIAYNAFLIAKTGANEFGTRFPLFFPVYTGAWTQYANPTQVYLLAIPFTVLKPSILVARVYSASWVFAACLLLGWLAKRISGKETVGLLIALIAIFTPWLFEVSRLVMETFFYPMAIVLFLFALYEAQKKESWSWMNVLTVALTLTLLTYSYTIGRLLGPLLAGGLILFATSQPRIISVVKTWVFFAVTLIPLLIFRSKNPEALTQRFYLISYIKPNTPWSEIIPKFIHRYFEDMSLTSLLLDGDGNPRHHVYQSLGAFLIAAFIVVVIGIVMIGMRHWREHFWRFVLFGAAASIVPGALTADQFHSLRLVAYPVFLLTLMIPGLAAFLAPHNAPAGSALKKTGAGLLWGRCIVLALLLIGMAWQAIYFQSVFRREGPNRGIFFDAPYKEVYDAAIAMSARPIFLVDGSQPSYEHALWYATVEGRDRAMFVHLEEGFAPPTGAIVISSEEQCFDCMIIKKSGGYLLYRTRQPFLP